MAIEVGQYLIKQTRIYSGSFAYRQIWGTDEVDVTALFSSYNLGGSDARELTIHFDIRNIQNDASAPNVIVRVKEKIDGTNDCTLDTLTVSPSDSPGVVVGPLITHRDIKITFQLSTPLSADNQSVPYTIERRTL